MRVSKPAFTARECRRRAIPAPASRLLLLASARFPISENASPRSRACDTLPAAAPGHTCASAPRRYARRYRPVSALRQRRVVFTIQRVEQLDAKLGHEAGRRIDHAGDAERHQAEQIRVAGENRNIGQESDVFQQRALAVSDFDAFERRHLFFHAHGEARRNRDAGIFRILVDEDRQRHGFDARLCSAR